MSTHALNKQLGSLVRRLHYISYPYYVDEVERQKEQFTRELEAFDPTAVPFTVTEQARQYKFVDDQNLVARAKALIQAGALAPYVPPEDMEMIDYDDHPDVEIEACSVCMCTPIDRRVGFNWIRCNQIRQNHLICTGCLLEYFENGNAKVDWDKREYYCQSCSKTSPFEYAPPTVEYVFNLAEPRRVLEYQRKNPQNQQERPRRGTPDTPPADDGERGAPEGTPRNGPPNQRASAQTELLEHFAAEKKFMDELKPPIRAFFETYHIPVPTLIPAATFNDQVDPSLLEEEALGRMVIESVKVNFFQA